MQNGFGFMSKNAAKGLANMIISTPAMKKPANHPQLDNIVAESSKYLVYLLI
jgi:hypothetical protein